MKSKLKVIILVGASGSGKSTKAQQIKDEAENKGLMCSICSADNYFIDAHGNYNFKGSELSYAHDECKANVVDALRNQVPIVIVDNTNTTDAERYFYEIVANDFGYSIDVIYMNEIDPNVLFMRNVHGVPLESIKKQLERIEKDRS